MPLRGAGQLPWLRGRPDAPSSSARHGSFWLTSGRGSRTEKGSHDANLMVMCYSTAHAQDT